jgi:hyperosmotically inducible periplasmic protein
MVLDVGRELVLTSNHAVVPRIVAEGGSVETNSKRIGRALALGAAVLFSIGLWAQQSSTAQGAPDNTKTNRARPESSSQQKENVSDRTMTQQIRKAIINDKSLSAYAHNVKVITQNGHVTLAGPVRSEEEKSAVEAKAAEVAGATNVTNQVEVTPGSNPKQ